ncbi:MAG: hypothetical protein AB1505_18505 [Candidatus Latescibacterota bacterium]
MISRILALAVLLAGFLLQESALAQEGIDFETEIQPIFTSTCALPACHTGETLPFGGLSGGGLVLLPGQAWEALVNVPTKVDPDRLRVVPGNSSESVIVLKLEGAAGVGGRMPQGRGPLDAETIQLIRDWIDQGALPVAPANSAVSSLSWGGVKAAR